MANRINAALAPFRIPSGLIPMAMYNYAIRVADPAPQVSEPVYSAPALGLCTLLPLGRKKLWCLHNFGRETISIQFTGGPRATARAGWCTLACRRWTAMSVMMLWQGVASVDSDILLSPVSIIAQGACYTAGV